MPDLRQSPLRPPKGERELVLWRERVCELFKSRWVDINIQIGTAVPGASSPDLITLFGGGLIHGAAFAYNITESVSAWDEVPHGLVLNQLVYAHCHYMPTTAAAGEAVFKMEYRWLNMGESAPSANTVSSGIVDMPEEAWYPNFVVLDSAAIDGDGKRIGSQFGCAFYRDHDDGEITSAYSADIVVMSAGIHFPVIDYGSKQIAGSG